MNRKKAASRGSYPRGFSVSVTALKTGATRVILWRRANSDGHARVKLLDTEIERDGALDLLSPDIGGSENRRRVKIFVQVQNL